MTVDVIKLGILWLKINMILKNSFVRFHLPEKYLILDLETGKGL